MCVFRVRDIERMDDGMEGNGWGERPEGGGINYLGMLWAWDGGLYGLHSLDDDAVSTVFSRLRFDTTFHCHWINAAE